MVHLRDVYVLNGGGAGLGISLIFPALNNNLMVFCSFYKMGNSGSLAEAEM